MNLRLQVRRLMVGSLVATAALLLLAIALGSFGELRTSLLLTAFGLFVGALLAHVELKALDAFPRLVRGALGVLVTSQALYYALIWTDLRRHGELWRFWWLAMVASVTTAHLVALFLPGDPKQNWWNKATAACAALCGVWFLSIGLGPAFPLDVTPLMIVLFLPPAMGSVVGSVQVWRRRIRKDGPPPPLPFWARSAWVVGCVVGAFGLGWYVGGAGHPMSALDEVFPSALSGLRSERIETMVREDVDRLKSVCVELDALAAKVVGLETSIREEQKRENRTFYKPEEDDKVRWAFVSYLSQRAALNSLAATYASYEAVREPELRARCFMVGYAAGCAAFEAGLSFVWTYRDNDPVRRKLNEGEPRWGLKPGMFDRIYDSVSDARHLRTMHEMSALYDARRGDWTSAWPADTYAWLDARILRGRDYVKAHAVSKSRAWLSRLTRQVKEDSYRPVYGAQAELSIWIGDTRITRDPPAISAAQIKVARAEMRPGDIILERRNWFLSNAFLPGFWPHGAMYVGSVDDIRRLGLADHPEVKSRLAAFSKPDDHGELPTVIESVSEGVVFNTLSHSIHADHVAVLRPRKLSEKQIGEAIVRAFSHQGKPYDFEFDFFTSDKLVCTELVYRAYEGFLRFDLVRVMGRDTLPALEIARKFSKELKSPEAELDFVLMLDALPGESKAIRVGPETLIESVDREKSFGR